MTETKVASYLDLLEPIASGIIADNASDVDQNGTYPRAAIEAMGVKQAC